VRLALVGPTHPYKGGIAQHTAALAHALTDEGADVAVWSWRRQYPARLYPGQQRVSGEPELAPFHPTSELLSWDAPLGWLRAGRAARGLDALVLTWTTPVQGPAYLGVLAGLHGHAPVLAVCHNVLPHEPRPGDRALTHAVLSRCRGVLVHTAAQELLAHRVAPDADVAVAPLPAPGLATSTPEPRTGPPTRALLFFGLVRPYKGLDVLLRALADPVTPPDVRLVVAGEFWTPVAQTRALVAELGLTARVDLRPGYVDAADLPALYASVDAAVLPYRSATASIVADTARSFGLPVLATRVGALPDAVRDGVDGVLVAPADPAALAAGIARLYDELPTLRAGVVTPDARTAWPAYAAALLGLLS